jgi:hypothetical protein
MPQAVASDIFIQSGEVIQTTSCGPWTQDARGNRRLPVNTSTVTSKIPDGDVLHSYLISLNNVLSYKLLQLQIRVFKQINKPDTNEHARIFCRLSVILLMCYRRISAAGLSRHVQLSALSTAKTATLIKGRCLKLNPRLGKCINKSPRTAVLNLWSADPWRSATV